MHLEYSSQSSLSTHSLRFEVDVPSYDVFIKRLQHPTSAEIVKAMQRFVTSFVQKQKYAKSSPSERLGLANGRGGGGGEGRNVAAASLHSFIQSLEVVSQYGFPSTLKDQASLLLENDDADQIVRTIGNAKDPRVEG